jgi:hypothetical protein
MSLHRLGQALAGVGSSGKSLLGLSRHTSGTETVATKPQDAEVEKQFIQLLDTMNVPAEAKEKLLKQSVDDKWALICQQATEKQEGSKTLGHYLEELQAYAEEETSFLHFTEEEKQEGYDFFNDLATQLRSASPQWLKAFLTAGGLTSLTVALLTNLLDVQVALPCIRAVKAAAKITEGLECMVRRLLLQHPNVLISNLICR